MPIITTSNDCLTIINVFSVDPSNQQKVLNLLTLATEIVRMAPGFISSSLHKSIDGEKVTMYAQWRHIEDYQKMRNDPNASTFLEQALEISTFQPGIYTVEKIFTPIK